MPHPARTRFRSLLSCAARTAIGAAVTLACATGARAQGASDALLAVESNRAGIVDSVVERFGAQVEALGFSSAALREQLMSLRADQLLAASLVRDLAALNLRPAESPDALQRYVAAEPTALREAQANAAALAYVVRIDGALKVVSPVELAALRGGPARDDQLVGYFVDARAVAVLSDSGLRLKDGSGTGPQSWIGYTAGNNQATAQGSAVMAGLNNTASGPVSAVISGAGNVASGQGALIGGGDLHQAQGNYSVIVGGYGNRTTASDAVIVGGAFNENAGQRSLLGAGARNRIAPEASYSFIGGGGRDTNVGTGAAGTDPKDNVAFSKWTFIGGGMGNQAGSSGQATAAQLATVVGGSRNVASGASSFVGGGGCNTASGIGAVVVGGGEYNLGYACDNPSAFPNRATADFAAVGGGARNLASGQYATVAGGAGGEALGLAATVGGGNLNEAAGFAATVAGGEGNVALGNYAAVGGGSGNVAGTFSTVGGGAGNEASGQYATAPGGESNIAAGNYSVALGRRAKSQSAGASPTAHAGAFVFADSSNFDFNTTAANQFRVRATGGVQFVSGINGTSGADVIGVSLPAGSGAWAQLSDRSAKADFATVDVRAVLARVLALPISTWRYRGEPSMVRHLGPVAQDFRRAFGLGHDDTTIATVDADGVALAAIQGLHALFSAEQVALRTHAERLAAENLELREASARLAREIAALRAAQAEMQAHLARRAPR